jgi:hypothetical protein
LGRARPAPPPRFLSRRDEVALFDSIAQRYHCRPSDIARGELWAWQFDLAVAVVASDEQAKKDGTQRLLSDPPTPTASSAPHADRAAVESLAARHGGMRRMAIPEDGIW